MLTQITPFLRPHIRTLTSKPTLREPLIVAFKKALPRLINILPEVLTSTPNEIFIGWQLCHPVCMALKTTLQDVCPTPLTLTRTTIPSGKGEHCYFRTTTNTHEPYIICPTRRQLLLPSKHTHHEVSSTEELEKRHIQRIFTEQTGFSLNYKGTLFRTPFFDDKNDMSFMEKSLKEIPTPPQAHSIEELTSLQLTQRRLVDFITPQAPIPIIIEAKKTEGDPDACPLTQFMTAIPEIFIGKPEELLTSLAIAKNLSELTNTPLFYQPEDSSSAYALNLLNIGFTEETNALIIAKELAKGLTDPDVKELLESVGIF